MAIFVSENIQIYKMRTIKTGILLMTALAAIASCRGKSSGQTENAEVSTITAGISPIDIDDEYSATIRGRQDIDIYPQVSGKIVKVCIKEGERVRKGQSLFIIDQVPYKAALERAKADVHIAQAQVRTARLEYESKASLYKDKVISEYELSMSEISLASAEAALEQAEASLAQSFYNVNAARASFYPSVTLSGSAGWTNNAGGAILNPAAWLTNAVASLTQPLFRRGANIAALRQAKAAYEEALDVFSQTLLQAGKEVNDAMTGWQAAVVRIRLDLQQVEALTEAVRKTTLLMRHSSVNYLEVLTARQSLLTAQQSLVQDRAARIQSVISLYYALGFPVE